MIRVTGLGLVPGTDPLEAQLAVVDELTQGPAGQGIGLPFEVQLVGDFDESSAPIARAASLLDQLFAERGPHGWKLADRPGHDLARAQHWTAQQLEATQIALSGYDGPLAVAGIGPVSLAARLYLARGDLAVSDHGAIRELAYAYAEGLAAHVASLREHVPALGEVSLHLSEPLLGAAVAGVFPNFSGMHRLRRVPDEVVDAALRIIVDRVGAGVTVHLGDSLVGLAAVRGAGLAGIGVGLGAWDEPRWSTIAECVEAGVPIAWGMPAPNYSQCAGPQIVELADRLWQSWRRIGLTGQQLAAVTLVDQARSRPRTLVEVRDRLASLVKAAEVLMERID